MLAFVYVGFTPILGFWLRNQPTPSRVNCYKVIVCDAGT